MTTYKHWPPSTKNCNQILKLIKKDDVKGVTALLKEHPELACTVESEWYGAFPNSHPFIFNAIDQGSAALVKAFLDAGSRTSAASFNRSGNRREDTITYAITAANPSIDVLETLVEQYDTATVNDTGWPPIVDYPFIDWTKEQDARSRKLFTELLQRTPAHHLPDYLFKHYLNKSSICPADTKIFLLQALAEKGLPLGADLTMRLHPFAVFMDERTVPHFYNIAAAMLAAGLREDEIVSWQSGKTVRDLIEEHGGKPRDEARKTLADALEKVTSRQLSPEALLINPYGNPTWQAQGLAAQGMLGELFAPAQAALFGGAEQQLALAGRLGEAFAHINRYDFDAVPMLRENALARPGDAATVRYLRAGAEQMHGGLKA